MMHDEDMGPLMIRILIVDDHPVVRRGLAHILSGEHDFLVSGEAENANEVFEHLKKYPCDVVLLDLSLHGVSGLEILDKIRLEYPNIAVLVLSVHPEDQYALRVLKGGASGYLTKETAPDVLVAAIRKVVKEGRYISTTLAGMLADEITGKPTPIHRVLSNREFQIMCLIACGKSLKEIGEELFISSKTVSTYRMRILEKMGMTNNAELTKYVVENKLL